MQRYTEMKLELSSSIQPSRFCQLLAVCPVTTRGLIGVRWRKTGCTHQASVISTRGSPLSRRSRAVGSALSSKDFRYSVDVFPAVTHRT